MPKFKIARKCLATTMAAYCCLLLVQLASAQTWTQTGAPVENWSCIACSADGSKLVALTTSAGAWTSTDSGVTWVSNSLPAADWYSVASSADGNRLVAAMGYPSSGPLYISTNSGTTWASSNITGQWSAVASSADGGKLLATSTGGGASVWTSTNFGINWRSNDIPYSPAHYSRTFLSAAATADGNGLVVGSYGSLIYNSTNAGLTWRTNNVPLATWRAVPCSLDGTKLVGIATNGKNYTSTNSGTTWTTNDLPRDGWVGATTSADGSKMIAVSFNIYTSTNYGLNWISNTVPKMAWGPVASSADGNKLFAMVQYGNAGIWTCQSTPSPKLKINPANGGLNLAWLVPATNVVLQQSFDLIGWANVTNLQTLNLTNLQNEVTLPPANSQGFYRLAAP